MPLFLYGRLALLRRIKDWHHTIALRRPAMRSRRIVRCERRTGIAQLPPPTSSETHCGHSLSLEPSESGQQTLREEHRWHTFTLREECLAWGWQPTALAQTRYPQSEARSTDPTAQHFARRRAGARRIRAIRDSLREMTSRLLTQRASVTPCPRRLRWGRQLDA
jgi:hypothetical protein